ncbi:MAG TPA: hypothetical protein VMU60_04820, partial [Syntrophobacteria bacterium]|nr:hypothetical protein [Syntrophobacteria bacterium]
PSTHAPPEAGVLKSTREKPAERRAPFRKWAGSYLTAERYMLGWFVSDEIVEMTICKLSYEFRRSL